MKKNKFFAILFISFIVITCICTNLYRVKAAINHEYLAEGSSSITYDEEEIIKSSPITDYLGSFIFTIGTIVQRIATGILSSITGGNSFPWSDRIIFNTIPILDVNFINPDSSSLLADNKIGGIIRNTYFSLLTLALGFLGIIVAVLAIRLAISTIASDKAKYKEAITKWVTAIVLLFGMHFVLSFLFYLNEQLVTVASKMLATQVKTASQEISKVLNSKLEEQKKASVENLRKTFSEAEKKDGFSSAIKTVGAVAGSAILAVATGGASLVAEVTIGTLAVAGVTNAVNVACEIVNNFTEEDAREMLYSDENIDIIYALQSNSVIQKECLSSLKDNAAIKQEGWLAERWNNFKNGVKTFFTGSDVDNEIIALMPYVKIIKETSKEEAEAYLENLDKLNLDDKQKQINKVIYNLCIDYKNGKINKEVSPNIISSLGEYFKFNTWYADTDNGDWSASSVSIVSAILYTMLVFQSIFFFIAYIKRFFLVVVLSLMAPLVVIYDFFSKSISL